MFGFGRPKSFFSVSVKINVLMIYCTWLINNRTKLQSYVAFHRWIDSWWLILLGARTSAQLSKMLGHSESRDVSDLITVTTEHCATESYRAAHQIKWQNSYKTATLVYESGYFWNSKFRFGRPLRYNHGVSIT